MTLSADFPLFFFFNDTATTEIYTLSLHDALPIFIATHFARIMNGTSVVAGVRRVIVDFAGGDLNNRSEEHTSELQSLRHLVCRLLLEKKKKKVYSNTTPSMTTVKTLKGATVMSTW